MIEGREKGRGDHKLVTGKGRKTNKGGMEQKQKEKKVGWREKGRGHKLSPRKLGKLKQKEEGPASTEDRMEDKEEEVFACNQTCLHFNKRQLSTALFLSTRLLFTRYGSFRNSHLR